MRLHFWMIGAYVLTSAGTMFMAAAHADDSVAGEEALSDTTEAQYSQEYAEAEESEQTDEAGVAATDRMAPATGPNSAVGGGVFGSSRGDVTRPARTGTSETDAKRSFIDDMSVNYFGIFHGPALGDLSSAYQPLPTGGPDRERPIFTQNYLNVNKPLTNDIVVTAQAYWLWQPVLDRNTEVMDPSLRISNNNMVSTQNFSLYSDLRTHFPVSERSRDRDLVLGLQTFHVAQYTVPGTQFSFGMFGSFRYNFFGARGFGRKMEFYGAPNIAYQITPSLAFTTLYQMSVANFVGDPSSVFYSDGANLEPGLRWDVTPTLTLSPYVDIMVNDRVSWRSTQFGMMVNWIAL